MPGGLQRMRSWSVLFIVSLLIVPAAVLVTPPAAAAPTYANTIVYTHDVTPLAVTVFLPAGSSLSTPVPFVLMTHGWAGSRTTTPTGRVAALLDAGYGVLTWDSRGFGQSGGQVMLNSPDYEVRDVSTLITWLATKPYVQKVSGDPVIGMMGGSYAGGIQLLSAAFDARIDAIAPEITWNNLAESLAPNDVIKTQWVSALFGAGLAMGCANGLDPRENGVQAGCTTPLLAQWYATAMATNGLTPEIRNELLYRSPATHMANIRIPTLLIQGYPDTLFDANQAIANYHGVKANGAPVKLWLYDGGHGLPSNIPGTQGAAISQAVVNWFDCHLRTTPDCTRVGAEAEYYVAGTWRASAAWPPAGASQAVTVPGIPPLAKTPTATSQGTWTVPLELAAPTGSHVGRAARVTATVRTEGSEGLLFFSLGVRDGAGVVTRVDDQVSPLRVSTGLGAQGTRHAVDLVAVAADHAGKDLVLTITTGDPRFAGTRGAGVINLEDVLVEWSSA